MQEVESLDARLRENDGAGSDTARRRVGAKFDGVVYDESAAWKEEDASSLGCDCVARSEDCREIISLSVTHCAVTANVEYPLRG